MHGKQSLDEMLSSEIKQDIAERYFSFRKLIEEDSMELAEKIKHYSFILEKRISFDLIRIYFLLKDETLIKKFLALTGIEEELFYDSYITTSGTIACRVFKDQHFQGLTRAGRFRNYLVTCYENLHFHTEIYRKKIVELERDREVIEEEIRQFYGKNDLSAIMYFLRSLNSAEEYGNLQGGLEIGLADDLDKKMKIDVPPPIGTVLTILPPLPPVSTVKQELKKLAGQAYHLQDENFLNRFSFRNAEADRRKICKGEEPADPAVPPQFSE